MTSSIAWLDTSADEQRRIRELIALFTQRESRDELGIGQIRDVFSDTLFPGTSVIQTRARYFLIIPWVFTVAAQRGRSGQYVLAHATNTERRLIELLRDAGQVDGLIGRLAGKNVKILPSTIYWSGLRPTGSSSPTRPRTAWPKLSRDVPMTPTSWPPGSSGTGTPPFRRHHWASLIISATGSTCRQTKPSGCGNESSRPYQGPCLGTC